MCFSFIFFSQINLPHGADLRTLVERGFARLDHNPNDGVVTEAEWDETELMADTNSTTLLHDHFLYTYYAFTTSEAGGGEGAEEWI